MRKIGNPFYIACMVVCSLVAPGLRAQVTGGQFAFEYLRLSNSPHVSAMGGISIANPDNDIAFTGQNPAMMRPGLHNQLDLDYNDYYAGIRVLNLQYGYYVPKVATAFFMGVQYLNYGSIQQTDNVGNTYGDFTPVDYAVTLGGARSYGEHWRYGADLKFAHSFLLTSTATALLADVGVNYYDSTLGLDFGATAKNMGTMIKEYTAGNSEPLPFDLQLGASKTLKHVPLKLFVTLHHLYEWDIRYNNPSEISPTNVLGTPDTSTSKASYFGDKLFRHFIFGAELNIAKKLAFTVSYNDLQRRELALSSQPGLAGFAFGLGLHLQTLDLHYARTYYHIAGPYNEFGMTLPLNRLFGLGATGEKIRWNKEYEDWE
jgi:hypothetical protein